jgi:hypothetical protein
VQSGRWRHVLALHLGGNTIVVAGTMNGRTPVTKSISVLGNIVRRNSKRWRGKRNKEDKEPPKLQNEKRPQPTNGTPKSKGRRPVGCVNLVESGSEGVLVAGACGVRKPDRAPARWR